MTRSENIFDGVVANVLSAVIIAGALALALPWIAKKLLPSFPSFPSLPWGK